MIARILSPIAWGLNMSDGQGDARSGGYSIKLALGGVALGLAAGLMIMSVSHARNTRWYVMYDDKPLFGHPFSTQQECEKDRKLKAEWAAKGYRVRDGGLNFYQLQMAQQLLLQMDEDDRRILAAYCRSMD